MDERRKSPLAVIVIPLVLVVLVAVYVGGYFGLTQTFRGAYWGPSGWPAVVRIYPHPVVVWCYYPAAFVEAKIGRKEVMIGAGDNSLYGFGP